MILTLACPNCWDAREIETIEHQQPRPCPECGALRVLTVTPGFTSPYFRLQCPACRHVYLASDTRAYIGAPPRCPHCGAPPAPPRPPESLDDSIQRFAARHRRLDADPPG